MKIKVDPLREAKALAVLAVGAGGTFIHVASSKAQWWSCFVLAALGVALYLAVSVWVIFFKRP